MKKIIKKFGNNTYIGSECIVHDKALLSDCLNQMFESGSNVDGNYVKFPDGTMICYGTINIVFQNQSVTLAQTFNYPATFVNNTSVSTLTPRGGDDAYMFNFTVLDYGSSFSVIARTALNNNVTATREVNYIAIGKWK